MIKTKKYVKIVDRNIRKVRTITGRAGDIRVTGEGLCGGVVDKLVRMRWVVSSRSISQMMCWMMMFFKIHRKKKKEN